MTARSLTWRLMVPLSFAIFLLVAYGQIRPKLEPFPETTYRSGDDSDPEDVALQVGDRHLEWESLSKGQVSAIRLAEQDGLLLIATEDGRSPTRAERRELARRLERFGPDLVLVPEAQGSFLPLFSRPEKNFGTEGYLRRWAEESEVHIYRWRNDLERDGTRGDLRDTLETVKPGLGRGERLALAGPYRLLGGLVPEVAEGTP